MNALKTAPLLALLLIVFMAPTASAQVVTQAETNVEINVDNAARKSRKGRQKKARRDRKRSSREDTHRRHKNRRNTVVHEHVVVHKHVVVHEHVNSPPPPQYYPMEDGQFARLIAQIHDEPFSSGKMSVISIAAEFNYFSSAQTRALVSTLTFSADKVEAAVLLYPMVLDPQGFYQVLSEFTFESSKDEVRARLGI